MMAPERLADVVSMLCCACFSRCTGSINRFTLRCFKYRNVIKTNPAASMAANHMIRVLVGVLVIGLNLSY